MKQKKFTIGNQFSFVFIVTMVFILFLYWLASTVYLERYYLWKKESAIYDAYLQFNMASEDNVLNTEEFDITWQKICSKYNIDVIILDADSRAVKCSSNDWEFLVRQLMDCFFNMKSIEENQYPRIIKEENNYTMHIVKDSRTETDYVEMWGVLNNGNLFLIRSPIESIRESVRISHQFLLYSGIGVIILGSFVLGIIAKRISRPILRLANISERMIHLDFDAKYEGDGAAEIEVLGKNINELSETLERTISELKTANNKLQRDIENIEKLDGQRREFLSNVSHELKTPVTALNATLENMILGVGKYKDYDTYLPECREMTGHLADMIHDILETSKVGMAAENEDAAEVDLPGLLSSLCEPFYRPDFARDRDKGGNGLGLYIVDTLLKTMDISYSFCPMEEPQGMRFTIHL